MSAEQTLALSVVQESMYLMDLFNPGSCLGPSNTICWATEWSGQIDATLVRQALSDLSEANDILRSRPILDDGDCRQVILPHGTCEIPLVVEDVTAAALGCDDSPEAIAVAFTEFVKSIPVPISDPPLARAFLGRIGAESAVLVLLFHALVFDAASKQLIAEQFIESYERYAAGNHGEPNRPPQYTDLLTPGPGAGGDEPLQLARKFWTTNLERLKPVRMRNRNEPPVERSSLGWLSRTEIDPDAGRRLREIAAQSRATLFMLLTALVHSTIRYWAQDDDVFTVTRLSTRRGSSLQMVGNFENVVLLQSRVDLAAPFTAVLEQVRDDMFQVMRHSNMPLASLAAEVPDVTEVLFAPDNSFIAFDFTEAGAGALAARRSSSGAPFEYVPHVTEVSGHDVERKRYGSVDVEVDDFFNTDLEFNVIGLTDESLLIRLTHSRDVFADGAGKKLLEDLQRLVRSVCLDPSAPLASCFQEQLR
jgi:hypothetical protein